MTGRASDDVYWRVRFWRWFGLFWLIWFLAAVIFLVPMRVCLASGEHLAIIFASGGGTAHFAVYELRERLHLRTFEVGYSAKFKNAVDFFAQGELFYVERYRRQGFPAVSAIAQVTYVGFPPFAIGIVPLILMLRCFYWFGWALQCVARGICAECGYDLRVTLAAGGDTCPECGQAIAQQTAERFVRRSSGHVH